ncbi:anthranilate synthase component I family protein [Marivirga harenae]|uniref:anthranilate synthase component I family protein n=1 Tax=Marivirga harenae TaxID=2010992 RepID=UPI0026E094D8|nr:anthranilate synthase component I family protein [Marivirga harenae]WKV12318.1 anthranilate synthase component I family protein [Marivirga harenae]
MKVKKSHITLPADSFTPVALYLRLRDQFPHTFLMESSDYHTRRNSFSYIGVQSIAEVKATNNSFYTEIEGVERTEELVDKLSLPAKLQDFINQFEAEDILKGEEFEESGFFGATGFDGVQYFEDINFEKVQEDIPFLRYHFYRFVLVFDHFKDELHVFEHEINTKYEFTQDDLVQVILNRSVPQFKFQKVGEESSNMSDLEFLEIINKGIAHAQLGDVFQMVLSRAFSQEFKGDEFTVYRALRSLNPSPYLFYFDYGDYKLFGSSPEAQVGVKGNKAYVNPIAGTYRRSGDDAADAKLAEQLLNDEKENAEHTMLVDLGRNDLSKHGSNVKVDVYKEIQFYSHVIHLVSKVTADVPEKSAVKLLADTFPAGTLSGAPKYKALELINKYEPTGRGLYGGAVGLIGLNGNLNHAIVIRSFVSKDNKLNYRAGAGIVALSHPQSELQEVHNKLYALRKAMEKAENLFDQHQK